MSKSEEEHKTILSIASELEGGLGKIEKELREAEKELKKELDEIKSAINQLKSNEKLINVKMRTNPTNELMQKRSKL